jgi:hypothetical protein
MIQGTFLKIPTQGDKGSSFCPAITEDLTILDSHNHNGTNSEKIAANSINKPELILASNGWVLSGGDYKQTATLPNGYDFDKTNFKFVINSGSEAGSVIHPTVVKKTNSTFDVYIMQALEIKVLVF